MSLRTFKVIKSINANAFGHCRRVAKGINVIPHRCLSDNITYSGGQASSGQGGFYGSGGSRAGNNAATAPDVHPQATARLQDVTELTLLMETIDVMENELRSLGTEVSSRSIEVKARIKKTISNPKVRDLLNRLEIKGEPVWGLSSKERDLVRAARDKYRSA